MGVDQEHGMTMGETTRMIIIFTTEWEELLVIRGPGRWINPGAMVNTSGNLAAWGWLGAPN